MRLLFLAPRLPWPPDRGDRLRAYHLLRVFAREHRVSLLTAVEGGTQLAGVEELRPWCESVHAVVRGRPLSLAGAALNAWRRLPLQALYYRDRRLRSELARLAGRRFDAVYAHLFRMGPYVLDRRLAGAHRIVDLTDVISGEIERSLPHRPALERRLYAHEAARISRYEAILALAVDETWVVSGEERQELVQRAPAADVRVVPNGVDGERFRPLPVEPVAGRLLFVGHMDVAHNLDAARFLVDELLPRICRQAPAATVRLVGAGGGRAIERLAARRGVEWAGFVPDLPAELAAAEVFVAPLRFSAGLQNKVLEAMAAALPVVTTPRVQAGLASVAGEHLLVGGDAESLVEAVLRLLRRPELRRRLGTAAREHVLSTFDWEPARGRLAAIEAQRSTELQPL